MKQVFDFQEPYYNLRSETSQFRRENIKTKTISFIIYDIKKFTFVEILVD